MRSNPSTIKEYNLKNIFGAWNCLRLACKYYKFYYLTKCVEKNLLELNLTFKIFFQIQ